jgi:hypothetical protein
MLMYISFCPLTVGRSWYFVDWLLFLPPDAACSLVGNILVAFWGFDHPLSLEWIGFVIFQKGVPYRNLWGEWHKKPSQTAFGGQLPQRGAKACLFPPEVMALPL